MCIFFIRTVILETEVSSKMHELLFPVKSSLKHNFKPHYVLNKQKSSTNLNKLLLNPSKTEFLLIGTKQQSLKFSI